MGPSKHLISFEREKIYLFYAQNKTITFIAREIGRHKSTGSRELDRNTSI